MEEETVTITKEEYEELKKRSNWLTCLEHAGVDNWVGWEHAGELADDYGFEVNP